MPGFVSTSFVAHQAGFHTCDPRNFGKVFDDFEFAYLVVKHFLSLHLKISAHLAVKTFQLNPLKIGSNSLVIAAGKPIEQSSSAWAFPQIFNNQIQSLCAISNLNISQICDGWKITSCQEQQASVSASESTSADGKLQP